MSTGPKAPVAVVASRYPKLSETFVYREVAALRARGRPVRTVTLRAPDAGGDGDAALLGDVGPADVVVYAPGIATRGLRELLRHPLRGLGTLALAVRDALAPGEPLSLRGRAALLVQAWAGLALADDLRTHGIGHLHCHFAHAPTGVGLYAARQIGGRFSFVGHANDLFRNRSLLRRKLARAAFVSCISQWHRDWYAGLVPSCAPRLHVVRCGVEPGEFAPGDAPADGPLRVLSVARLVPKKGIDLLVRALAESDLDWRLDVVGDGPERASLEALARELGVGDRVTLHGPLPNDRVAACMREADLFALPCRVDAGGDRDGIPVVLMEAMATGLPVVAGDLPTLRDLVRPDETGLLTPPGEVSPLREALRRLAGDAALRERLARAGRRHVEEEFSLAANAARLDAQLP
ncbi:MAG: glycosyltransferase family 4 protein [Myxococcota bacterium]